MTNSRTGSSCYWRPFPVKEKVVCAQSFIKSCTTCCVASVLLVWLSQNGKHSSIRDAHNPTWGTVHGNTLGRSFKPRHSVIKQHIVVTSSKRTASELFCCADGLPSESSTTNLKLVNIFSFSVTFGVMMLSYAVHLMNCSERNLHLSIKM